MSENSEEKQKKVHEVRNWLLSLPFRNRADAEFINKFLYGCKFDVAKTKKKIMKYYQARKDYPELMTNRNFQDPQLISVFNKSCVTTFEVLSTDMKPQLVLFVDLQRLGEDDLLISLSRLALIVLETCFLLHPQYQQAPISVLANVRNMKNCHILQATPRFLYRSMKCLFTAMPVRIEAIYMVNFHPALAALLCLFKSLLKQKLRERLRIYNTWDSFVNDFGYTSLPADLGGPGDTVQHISTSMYRDLMRARNYLLADEQFGYL